MTRVAAMSRLTACRKATAAFLLISVLGVIGCKPESRLAGPYTFVQHGCDGRGLVSDRLILHPDGTFEQHTILKSGSIYESHDQKWKYLGGNTLRLDSRKDFSSPGGDIQKPEVLKVELTHPQIIHLSSGCYYTQPK